MEIIFEDDYLIAVNKPSGKLSVPGKENRVAIRTRAEEWRIVIETLLTSVEIKEPSSSFLPVLIELRKQGERVPRQDQKFFRYVKRVVKSVDDSTLSSLFQLLSFLDREMFGVLPEDFPVELISAADEMERYCNQKLFHLHRLDQETSGLLLFGKDSISANSLSEQFRERKVS
jgi:succinate dehydrogenase flavin-adding protein (antitoxin of CptAB toxin-antitoxin module)